MSDDSIYPSPGDVGTQSVLMTEGPFAREMSEIYNTLDSTGQHADRFSVVLDPAAFQWRTTSTRTKKLYQQEQHENGCCYVDSGFYTVRDEEARNGWELFCRFRDGGVAYVGTVLTMPEGDDFCALAGEGWSRLEDHGQTR